MCRKNNLNYGRPKDPEYRKYYNDTKFNFNNLIIEHFNKTQSIKCENGHEFPFELHDTFKKFSMNCPECLKEQIISVCKVEVSNQELINKIKRLEKTSLQLDDTNEYNILDCLNQYRPSSKSSYQIAEIIDCSWQFVSKRVDKLIEQGLVEIDHELNEKKKKRYFYITEKAIEMLFSK